MTTGSERRAERRRRVERRRRRRRVAKVVLIALPFVVAIGVLLYLVTRPDPRAGSERLPDGPVAVASRIPESYRITYRVEDRLGGTVSTERVSVRRPFDARTEVLEGPPPGSDELSVQVSSFARLGLGETVLQTPPDVALADRRPDASLEAGLERGLALELERRRVAGRMCRVIRVRIDETTRRLAAVDPESTSFTDVCIDEAGLVLEEVDTVDGDIVRREIAVEVDEDVSLDDELFRVGEPTLEARQGGGSVREADPSSRPQGTFWELEDVPSGFEHRGRYGVVPPQTGFDDPVARRRIIAGVVDVWVDGPDVIVVDQGATLEGADPFGDTPGAEPVDLGELGEGELLLSLRTPEVRIELGGGRFVRVYGSVGSDVLTRVAQGLTEVEGEELVYLDDDGPTGG